MTAVSDHVFRYDGKRGPVWRPKYRLPDGRQVQKTARARPGRPEARPQPLTPDHAWLRLRPPLDDDLNASGQLPQLLPLSPQDGGPPKTERPE